MVPSHQPLGLPEEILINIISYLDIPSLAKASRVSKHFDDLVEPFLYRNQSILRGCHASALSDAIDNRSERIRWIESLLVSTKFGDDNGLETLPSCLRRMNNLKVLTLETPDCNRRPSSERISWINLQDRYELIFEASSVLAPIPVTRLLPRLETCTIHFVDNRTELYSLTKYPSIFLHPTLKSLTISCMSTDFLTRYDDRLHMDESLKRSTALEYLHLEECDIESETLAMILSYPRALKSLKISEGIRYDTGFRLGASRLHGNIRPLPLMHALTEACADNLESLSLSLGYHRASSESILHPGKYLRMITMEKLLNLEVHVKTLDLLRPSPNCDHNSHRRMPPNIRTLKVFGILLGTHYIFQSKNPPKIPLQSCFIREKAKHGVPNLETVIYEFEHYDDMEELEYNLPDIQLHNDGVGQRQPGHGANPAPGLFARIDAAALLNDPHFAAITGNPNLLADAQNQPPAVRELLRNALLRSNNIFDEQASRFTRTQESLITLLDILNQEVLPHHKASNTFLRVDLRMLPHGFIPPYLSTEDKPVLAEGWWTSENPRDIEEYKSQLTMVIEARSFERGLIAERNRQRRALETDEDEYSDEEDHGERPNFGEFDLDMGDDGFAYVLPDDPPQHWDQEDDDDVEEEDDSEGSLYVDAQT